ncbi:MAG: magnesium transporter [bacterium]|nr:MAG: magnesium transporter [bacterium]KAF0147797.1 MAG: magnesium transporter [bacterium]KAF0167878.1 MAG: magnesium transporter [bacterium]TXT18914.1 MAG: magnesium transporter [bacterium]
MAGFVSCQVLVGGRRRAIPLADVSEAIAAREGLVWMEFNDPDKPTLERLQEELDLHELAVEDALSAHQRPKVEDYAGGLFVVLRTARLWDNRIEYGETHIFCGPAYLAIMRHDTGPGYDRVLDRLEAYGRPITIGLALYALLDHIVDELRPLSARLEDRYADLEAAISSDGFSAENLQFLFETKREILGLMGTVQPIPEICGDLIRLHHNVVDKELRAYYRDVEDHAIRLIENLDRLRNMIADAMQLSLASAAVRQSESVQKLAGWGAMLAVPTVVFSLYGMNFRNMPELDWAFGYPLVLALTAATCLWLYRRLKLRGWI